MTLCIAAKTYSSYDGAVAEGSVITCSDWRIETPTAAADIASKSRLINYQWEIMMAGVFSLAVELTNIFEQQFRSTPADDLGVSVIERLRRPIDAFKARAAERFARSHYAVSREEFLVSGLSWMGDQLFREALNAMHEYILSEEKQIQLLIIGKDDDGFLAIYKYSSGELWECDGFAAIGSGETIAEAVLYQRRIEETSELSAVVYAVYEAKRLGEITPGVGQRTSVSVFDIDEVAENGSYLRGRHVTKPGLEFLERQFSMFGPRPYAQTVMPTDYLGVADQGQAYRLFPQERATNREGKIVPESTTHDPTDPPPPPG